MTTKSPFNYINLSNCRFPHPVTNPRDKSQTFLVPCRHCANCRVNRRSKLEALTNFELLDCYKRGLSASFVTLTYSPDYVPVKAFSVKSREPVTTLDYDEFRHFMMRVRKGLQTKGLKHDFKYIACGEYSPQNSLPHYHFAAFGVDPLIFEKIVRDKWSPRGMLDFGSLSSGGIRYILSYLDVSIGGRKAYELYSKVGCEPPKVFHSKNLGYDYIKKNQDYFKKTNYQYYSKGKYIPLPKNVRNRLGVFDYQIPDSAYSDAIMTAYNQNLDVVSYLENKSYLQEYENINRMREKGVPFSGQSLLYTPFGRPNDKFNVSKIVKEVLND